MKNSILLLTLLLTSNLLFAQSIIKVNNRNLALADYTNLQEAVDNAQSGDMIQVYPSPESYGNVTIDKSLRIIGPGYKQNLNPTLEITTTIGSAIAGSITLKPGADGALVEGMTCTNFYCDTVSQVFIKRIQVTNWMRFRKVTDAVISGSYFPNAPAGYNRSSLELFDSENVQIINNLFLGFQDTYYNPNINNHQCHSGTDNLYVHSSCQGTIVEHNIFRDITVLYHSLVQNNIFIFNANCTGSPIVASSTSFIGNNIFSGYTGDYGNPTNITDVDASVIFTGWPTMGSYTFDSRWELSPGSPALGAGFGGVDCGIFAGSEPYKLSGIPGLPLIYRLQVPNSGTTGGGLDVNIKVRAEN